MKKDKRLQFVHTKNKLHSVINPLEGTGFENAITFQANSIIEACRNLTLLEARLFYLGMIYVRPQLKAGCGQEEFKEELIPSTDIIKIFGDSHCYNKLKKVSESLQSKLLYIKNSDDPDVGFCRVNIFDKMQFDSKLGGLVVKFNGEMRPYLLYLYDKAYTRIALRDIFCLSSPYAIRVLELMLEYQNIENFKKMHSITRKVSIEYLRTYCMIDKSKYKSVSNFTMAVVDVAVNEINENTVYNISYEKIRTGNKITGYIFYMQIPDYVKKVDNDLSNQEIIEAKQEIKVKKANAEMATVNNPNADVTSILIHYGVGKIVAGRLAKTYDRERIISNIRYSISQQHRVRNMGAYIARAVKEDYYTSKGSAEDCIKSVTQLDMEYKAKLEEFLQQYGLPAFWASEFMDDNAISSNRRNSTFARIANEKGFDLETLIISVQKRELPEPPVFENAVKFVPESEIQAETETAEEVVKEYPQGTELERKLENSWVFMEIMDFVIDGRPMSPFVEGRIIEKGLNVEAVIAEAKSLIFPEEIIAEETECVIDSESEIKNESAVSPVSEPAPTTAPQNDIMGKLKELSQMYQAGLLTDEEFKAAKKAVLSL